MAPNDRAPNGNPAQSGPARSLALLAYLAAFAGVCGHASSEFVVKLTQLQGAEVTVWRFMLGGAALVLVSLARPQTRDLLTPLRQAQGPRPIQQHNPLIVDAHDPIEIDPRARKKCGIWILI